MFSIKKCVLTALTLAMITGLSTRDAAAGHGYGGRSHGGGGGFNWKGAVNQAIQGAARSHGHHQGHHQAHRPQFRPQQHHVQPQHRPVHVQPTFRSARPTYNPMPQHRVHIQPAVPHRHAVPRVNVAPRMPVNQHLHVTPRTNVVPRVTFTPRTNVAPRVMTTHIPPRTNVVPQAVAPLAPARIAPRPNSVPPARTVAAAPAPNRVPQGERIISDMNGGGVANTNGRAMSRMGMTPAPTNPGVDNFVADVTQADLDRMISQINDRDRGLLGDARQIPLIGLGDALDNLPNADQLSPADRQAIRDAIANGDPDAVRDLLGDAADSPAGADLIDRAAAIQMIDDLRRQMADDAFAGDDLANLVTAAMDLALANADQQALLDLIGQVAVDQQVIDWLQDADPGVGDVPFGPDVPIVLVPGLPEGMMMPLDGGPVMIGTGEPGEEILLGTGNPAEVAGLPVALPGAEPAATATGPIVAGQTILANPATETVNYNLNEQPQQMAPNFEQTLPGTTSWVIEFDRGGNFGMARYQLSEGYYYFKSTEQGWELVRKTFQTKLDNTDNKFAFNYMIDDQQQTINPGETHDLTGPFPPVLRFDNGSSQEQQRRLDSGTYKVALGEGMKLDIYKSESVSTPQASEPTSAPTTIAAAADSKVAVPAPKPAAVTVESSTTERTRGQRLPQGFTLFNPVKALTDAPAARKLPKSFTLFRSAADRLQAATTAE